MILVGLGNAVTLAHVGGHETPFLGCGFGTNSRTILAISPSTT